MVFSSLIFLFLFLPITLFVYFISPNVIKNSILLIVSFIFYAWGEPQYILLMILSVSVNYFFGLGIYYFKSVKTLQKSTLALAIVFNLAILSYYKYSGFFLENINNLFGTTFEGTNLALPIGISFYTFQALSYLIDVYRKSSLIQRNPFNLALYIALFPQLVAGPIVRYDEIEDQLKNRVHSIDKFYEGLGIFTIGLAKKLVIANQMAVIADDIFSQDPSELSLFLAWIGIIAYAMQIYFDFCGYSEMAIGLGKMFGFDFPRNFNYPYISKSISEFWRRWHITLGSWFRDYLYIPLGGNRVSKWKGIRNLFIVWFLTGLWHGASWNFIVWGLFYGVIIALEKTSFGKKIQKLPAALQHSYVIILFLIGWVIFRSPDLPFAIDYLAAMAQLPNSFTTIDPNIMYYLKQYGIEFAVGLIATTPLLKNLMNKEIFSFKQYVLPFVYLLLLAYCSMVLMTSSYNPFIYFRF